MKNVNKTTWFYVSRKIIWKILKYKNRKSYIHLNADKKRKKKVNFKVTFPKSLNQSNLAGNGYQRKYEIQGCLTVLECTFGYIE